ncbi:MAG: hypothetical protein LBS75_04250 [Synergistaceae bacterium]|jgi:hypothetical protein|nr:hypothetical protein [Synergistaceae bacterium]
MNMRSCNPAFYCVGTVDAGKGRKMDTVLNPPLKFLEIRRLPDAARRIVRGESSGAAMGRMGGGLVYFQASFGKAAGGVRMSRECGRTLSLLRDLDLSPFVRLDISSAPKDAGGEFLIERMLGELLNFAKTFAPEWREPRSSRVSFETMSSETIGGTLYMEIYAAVYRLLKDLSGEINAGFRHAANFSARGLDTLERRLISCRNNSCEPDFVTLAVSSPAQIASRLSGGSQIESIVYAINDCVSSVKHLYIEELILDSGHMAPAPLTLRCGFSRAPEPSECGVIISGIVIPSEKRKKRPRAHKKRRAQPTPPNRA